MLCRPEGGLFSLRAPFFLFSSAAAIKFIQRKNCLQRLPCCEVDCVSQRDGGRSARHDTLDSNAGNFVTRLLYEVGITPTLVYSFPPPLLLFVFHGARFLVRMYAHMFYVKHNKDYLNRPHINIAGYV